MKFATCVLFVAIGLNFLILFPKTAQAVETLKPELTWKRSTEAQNSIVSVDTLGSGVNSALALPLNDSQVVFDNGTFTPQENKTNVPLGNKWASWPQYSRVGATCGPKFELRHFQAKFNLPAGLTVNKVILASSYYSDPTIPAVFPINDNAYILLNGTKIAQLGTNYGALNRGFHGTAPIANETDGWIANGDLGSAPVNHLKAGENILDIVAEERCLWGGIGNLELKLEVEEIMLSVPYFDQKASPWGDDIYDHATNWSPQNPSIGRWGCALSSVAMILRKWGVDQLPDCSFGKCPELRGLEVNPGNLNQWLLKELGGYTSDGRVNWEAIETLTMRARTLFKTIVLNYKRGTSNRAELENEIREGRPAVIDLGPEFRHFVVAKGIIPQKSTFAINDSDRKYATDLIPYNNDYDSIRKFIPTGTNLSTLLIAINPPVDFIVTDPVGRKTGFDSDVGLIINEIPGANYYVENSLSDDNESGAVSGTGAREFLLETPLTGSYNVEVVEDQTQEYEIMFYGYDTNATPNIVAITGSTFHGGINRYLVSYDSTPGTQLEVTQIIQIDIKPGINPNSVNLKSNGVIPVSILTIPSFDATQVDSLSVKFGPNQAQEIHNKGHLEDADSDGDTDLILHFKTQDIGIEGGDSEICLTGKTIGGIFILGCDSIRLTNN